MALAGLIAVVAIVVVIVEPACQEKARQLRVPYSSVCAYRQRTTASIPQIVAKGKQVAERQRKAESPYVTDLHEPRTGPSRTNREENNRNCLASAHQMSYMPSCVCKPRIWYPVSRDGDAVAHAALSTRCSTSILRRYCPHASLSPSLHCSSFYDATTKARLRA